MQDSNKLVTYSLLAQINTKNGGVSKLETIFIPLVKKGIAEMNEKGVTEGASTIEIKKEVDKLFGLDIPMPLLNQLLKEIAVGVNEDEILFKLNNDGSFQMRNYMFSDVDEAMDSGAKQIELVEKLYDEYLLATNYEGERLSIVDFIDLNKLHLSNYFSSTKTTEKTRVNLENEKYQLIARFLDDLKLDPSMFKTLRQVYLGSVLASYLEYNIENVSIEMELLLDTSFLLSVLNLKSEEAYHTCNKIIEIGKKMSFKLSILPITIEEARNLLEIIARNLDDSFIERYVDPESIYNACQRRNINRTDLERITSKIESAAKELGINIIAYDENLRKKAKHNYPNIYQKYIDKGKSAFSALHDTCAEVYVYEKRTKKVNSFIEAQSWFVIYGHNFSKLYRKNGVLPATIRAEELVNILWLTNPEISSAFKETEFANLGITRLISTTLSDTLPTSKVLRQLDDNLKKYSNQNITPEDCVLAASKIAEKREKEIIELNLLADNNSEDFIAKINEFAQEEKNERIKWQESVNKVVKSIQDEYKKEVANTRKSDNIINEKDSIISDKEVKISLLEKKNNSLNWLTAILIVTLVILGVLFIEYLIPNQQFITKPKVKTSFILLAVSLSLLIPLKKQRGWLLSSLILPIILLILESF